MGEAQFSSPGSNAAIDMAVDGAEKVREAAALDVMNDADALAYEHPDYVEEKCKWKKYEDCYQADDIYKYIYKHPRESEDMFRVRVKRGYFYNYCASVVDLFVAYLFHAPIARDLGNDTEWLQELYDDADLAGTKYSAFLNTVETFAQIYGHCGVLVDAPAIDGQIVSEAQRRAAKLRPYLTIVRPSQILDWELDSHGNWVWVKIEVCRPDPERSWNRPVDEESKNYLIWTREDWTEFRVSGDEVRQVGSGDHGLGVVPLVIVRNEKQPDHSWFGASAIRDIADINIAILNWSSLGDEEIAERCLNILTMERDQGDMPATLSHHNVLEYSPGATPPAYLTPGSTPLELIGKWIDRAKDEIYRLAKLGGSTGLLGVREATSGIAYAYEFNETNQSLARKAEYLEQAEIEIHRLAAKWLKKEFTGNITYPKEFGVDDFLTEFAILNEARSGLSSEIAIKELEKKLAAKLFARDSMDLRKKVDQEIESSDPKSIGLMESFSNVPTALTSGPSAGSSGDSNGSPTGSTG